MRDSVVAALQMPLPIGHLLRHGHRMAEALQERRSMRPRQARLLHRLVVA
ncbi:MAG TPA: hypothetical protein VGL42_15050 [Opitutaceae bacterium]